MGVLFAIAAIGLVAAYIGIQSARDLILSRITINSAQQWAEILSFSASDPAKSYETEILTSRASERFAQAITDGLIVWYRVYDPDGKIALSSNQDGLESLNSTDLDALRRLELVSRSGVQDSDGTISPTTADAFLALRSGEDLLGFVGVRISRAEAVPLLDQFLRTGYIGLLVLVITLGAVSLGFLRRYLHRQEALKQNLIQLAEDSNRAEAVAKVGHWSADSPKAQVQWSPEMYVIYGRDPETFVPTPANIFPCFIPEERERVQESVDRMVETGGEMEIETRIERSDGNIRHVYIKGGVNTDDNGEIVRIFGVTQDITERKEIDLALTRNEDMLDRAIKATDAAIWDWDIIENHLFTTPQFAVILGLDPESWHPSMELHNSLCHPDDLDHVRKALQKHIEDATPYDIEYRMKRADGTYVWIHSRGRAVRDKHGSATRMVGSVMDITQRREEQDHVRQNEETLQLAIQTAEAGFFDLKSGEQDVY